VLRGFLEDQQGRLVEDALTLPVLLLVALALVNMFQVGMADLVAQNAAHYGARMGAVAQQNSVAIAKAAAQSRISQVHSTGIQFQVSVQADNRRGSVVVVHVTYRVPNYFAGLSSMMGVNMPQWIEGHAEGRFRHEGW